MLRQFQDIANDRQHPVGQHPEDYVLFLVGEDDERSGETIIYGEDKKESLGRASDYLMAEGEENA